MASGLPDYYRGVDISYQTLGEITNRPKYGAAESVIGVVIVTANDITTLVSVSGKGMIYGGVVHLTGAQSQRYAVPRLVVDGQAISTLDFNTLNLYAMSVPVCNPFSILNFNDVKFRYAVCINFGFTFEQSFLVDYEEKAGGTPPVVCRVAYALI